MYSMIGGKLASYRIFAQEMTDQIAKRFGNTVACTTHTLPLPGGDRAIETKSLATFCQIDEIAARRLVYRHGSLALEIADAISSHRQQSRLVCVCEAISEAEIRHVVRTEFVRTIGDLSRRVRLGCGPCGGMRCILRCAAIVADELGQPPRAALADAIRFMQRLSRTRTVAMGPVQARQEALALASLRAHAGIGLSELERDV